VADAGGTTMSEIVGSVQRVTDIIGEITAAASEQSERHRPGQQRLVQAVAHSSTR
jgi:methyl-accepting chemotaxis protein